MRVERKRGESVGVGGSKGYAESRWRSTRLTRVHLVHQRRRGAERPATASYEESAAKGKVRESREEDKVCGTGGAVPILLLGKGSLNSGRIRDREREGRTSSEKARALGVCRPYRPYEPQGEFEPGRLLSRVRFARHNRPAWSCARPRGVPARWRGRSWLCFAPWLAMVLGLSRGPTGDETVRNVPLHSLWEPCRTRLTPRREGSRCSDRH